MLGGHGGEDRTGSRQDAHGEAEGADCASRNCEQNQVCSKAHVAAARHGEAAAQTHQGFHLGTSQWQGEASLGSRRVGGTRSTEWRAGNSPYLLITIEAQRQGREPLGQRRRHQSWLLRGHPPCIALGRRSIHFANTNESGADCAAVSTDSVGDGESDTRSGARNGRQCSTQRRTRSTCSTNQRRRSRDAVARRRTVVYSYPGDLENGSNIGDYTATSFRKAQPALVGQAGYWSEKRALGRWGSRAESYRVELRERADADGPTGGMEMGTARATLFSTGQSAVPARKRALTTI